MKLEEIEDKINSKLRERDKLILKAEEYNKELLELLESKNILDPLMEKIVCFHCNSLGRIKKEDGSQTLCPTCEGKGYVWLKKYISTESTE